MNALSSQEKRFRYDCSGEWYKGCVHVHTTLSDGGLTPDKVTAFYAQAGYDFISFTDHGVPFIGDDSNDKRPLMVLDGIELDGLDDQGSFYHILCLGGVNNITKDMKLMDALERARSQGSFIIWAHPYACGNSAEDGIRHVFDGVEIYNSSANMGYGRGISVYHWDATLLRQPNILGFATDDSHFIKGVPAEKGGWIMVNAPELSREALMVSIRKGNFYSSNGPDFKSIIIEKGNRIVAETSPVSHVRFIGPWGRQKYKGAADGEPITETHFRLPDDWAFARIEIEDENGKIAWSNPFLFEA
jgi:hypothetical protein